MLGISIFQIVEKSLIRSFRIFCKQQNIASILQLSTRMDGGGETTKTFVAGGSKDVAGQECNLLCSMDGDNVCRGQKSVSREAKKSCALLTGIRCAANAVFVGRRQIVRGADNNNWSAG